ncbi:hypothetical protein BC941DRAFT_509637 [Chlamydoabsidia padenii]|nr:hypothetical protein BC941DRAFT_509637 [Chlamydoabsidia padenii]
MQQQEIIFRKTTFKLLSRADALRQTWNTYQSATLNILSTLVNLRQQQSMTTTCDWDKYSVDPQRLLYKQTIRFERAMVQLRERMNQWQLVIQDWQQLVNEAQLNATKAEVARLTNNTGNSSHSNDNNHPPLSSHSLLQVTAVSPAQALQWILQLEHLYKRQYHCKKMLLLSATNETDIPRIMDQWSDETHLQNHPINQDIADRLQLYNHVKKAIESI